MKRAHILFITTVGLLIFCYESYSINTVTDSEQNYYDSLKAEKVYLHTDRNIYMAGDYLFYTLYLQGNPGQMSKYAYFVLRGQPNSLISGNRLAFNNQVAFGSIYLPDTLHSGIYQVVCYTNCMRNDVEDSYFHKEIIIANRFDKEMHLLSDQPNNNISDTAADKNSGNIPRGENLVFHLEKQVFGPGEKVSFSIETTNIPENSISHLSVSISEIVPGIPIEPSISDYFLTNSKFITEGKLVQNFCRFYPEINGAILQGKVALIEQPGKNVFAVNHKKNSYTVTIATADSIVNMQYTTTDSLGSFGFLLNPYYDNRELFIRLKENLNAVIEIDNKFNLIQPFTPSTLFKQPIIRACLIRSRNIFEINKNYSEPALISTQKEFLPATESPRVYYKPNFTVYPADFLELPDFVEISRELLPALNVRKSNKNYMLNFIDIQDNAFSRTESIIFLDGVPIDDVNQIISLGSKDIKRIDILPVVRYFGEMPIAGILSVFSKNSEINTIQFKTPTIRYPSLYSQAYTRPEHFKPMIDNKHFPDLRQLLLWEPEIILKAKDKQQIACYASDLQGEYLISIQGITSTGIPVSGYATISIHSN